MAKKEDSLPTIKNSSEGSYQFFQLNEIRRATDVDFEYFIHLANEYGEDTDWVKKHDKSAIKIWQKETGASSVKMALVSLAV